MIAAEELARLQVQLVALPGFDAEALDIYAEGLAGLGRCLYDEVEDPGPVLVAHVQVWSHGLTTQRPRTMCRVGLADASTADRLARWIAGRVGLEVGCTAPYWRYEPIDEAWVLVGGDWHSRRFSLDAPPASDVEFAVAALADLDPADDRRLADGSRFVDRLALALVAAHVGGGQR